MPPEDEVNSSGSQLMLTRIGVVDRGSSERLEDAYVPTIPFVGMILKFDENGPTYRVERVVVTGVWEREYKAQASCNWWTYPEIEVEVIEDDSGEFIGSPGQP